LRYMDESRQEEVGLDSLESLLSKEIDGA
jgi:hypothetical protein